LPFSLCLPSLALLFPLSPYTTLFRSGVGLFTAIDTNVHVYGQLSLADSSPKRDTNNSSKLNGVRPIVELGARAPSSTIGRTPFRSEEHTSELQSRFDLVCRLLLEKKK